MALSQQAVCSKCGVDSPLDGLVNILGIINESGQDIKGFSTFVCINKRFPEVTLDNIGVFHCALVVELQIWLI